MAFVGGGFVPIATFLPMRSCIIAPGVRVARGFCRRGCRRGTGARWMSMRMGVRVRLGGECGGGAGVVIRADEGRGRGKGEGWGCGVGGGEWMGGWRWRRGLRAED